MKIETEKQKFSNGQVIAVIYFNLKPNKINGFESLTSKISKVITTRIPIKNHNC